MVWGCITSNGVRQLYHITGMMNAIQYCRVLEQTLIPSIIEAGFHPWSVSFQQDNARVHMAKISNKKITELGLLLMPWPAGSPDMNIIEHVWAILKIRIRHRTQKPKNLDELWVATQEEWYRIPKRQIETLYESVPRLIDALVEARGWHTKY